MSEQAVDAPQPKLTKKDFTSDQMVRWCPGCGDYSILSAMQNALPQIPEKKRILCSSPASVVPPRYPILYEYLWFSHHSWPGSGGGYWSKNLQPQIEFWQITGDGDALAIGGNHFIHAIRRNIDINILLFNNEIYGLTKVNIVLPVDLVRLPSQPQWEN